MHSLSIIVGPAIWTLMFKTEEAAATAYDALHPEHDSTTATAEDDFGQAVALRRASIHGLMFEDLDASKEAVVERMIHNAKVQAEAQQKASRDSSLRHAAQGPAVLSPGMQRWNG